MNVHVARPAAKQLTYQLYARVLHPELFDTCALQVVERDGYLLDIRVCEAGHVVELHAPLRKASWQLALRAHQPTE